MLRMFHSNGRRFGSALAMALVFTGGTVAGTAALQTPALAQSKDAKPKNSKAFAEAYQPVAAVVNTEGGDYASAKAQLPAVIAAVETPDDRYMAGNLALLTGNKLKDPGLQRQGLELMLASGKVDPAQAAQFNFFIGSLAYDAKDWAAARTAMQAAIAGGYTAEDPEGLIAETYFQEGQSAQGLAYLKQTIEARTAAGKPVPEAWLLRGLKFSYDSKDAAAATEWSKLLVASSPSEKNWVRALQVVNAVNTLEPQTQLDLLRLMSLTNSLSERREYVTYIETADPRIMANEVGKVLDAAVQKGVITTSDQYYAEVKRVVDERGPADRAEAPKLADEARKASTGKPAQNAGDVYFSLGMYAEAAEMFQMALDKGGVDRDQTLTRLGIAQVQQGKMAEANTAFGQVAGSRAVVAQMWQAYIQSKA